MTHKGRREIDRPQPAARQALVDTLRHLISTLQAVVDDPNRDLKSVRIKNARKFRVVVKTTQSKKKFREGRSKEASRGAKRGMLAVSSGPRVAKTKSTPAFSPQGHSMISASSSMTGNQELRDLLSSVLDRPEEWLTTPNEQFGGRRPADLINTQEEYKLLDLLRAVDQGVF